MKVLVTGAAGFICGYLVAELLHAGHEVVGVDNYSKYGPVKRSFDSDPRYRLVEGDAKDPTLLTELAADCAQLVAGAAMVGVISSSMVFESASIFPTPEGAERTSPPPRSTYGFQKLATEFFAHGAYEQYGLPFTIVRPFNCVGIGERRALRDHQVMSGNVKLAMSHVVPDLCQKALKGQDPLHILGDGSQVRHYTYGGDLARGIRVAMESERALNDDFNLSTARSTTVRELAELIWRKVHGEKRPLNLVSDPPYEHDVQMRVPEVSKAREVLGFEATTSLDEMLDEVIPWIRDEIEAGRI